MTEANEANMATQDIMLQSFSLLADLKQNLVDED